MTFAALFLLLTVQDAPDIYKIQLKVEAEDNARLGMVLNRHIAELPGVRLVRYQPRLGTVTLTMEVGTIISRAEIENLLPRWVEVKKYEVWGLAGAISRVGKDFLLKMPGIDWKFHLVPTGDTHIFFEAPGDLPPEDEGWAVWGPVEEKIIRKGDTLHVSWTVHTERIEVVQLPRTPAERELEERKKQSIVVHVLLNELQDGLNSGRAAADAANEFPGVVHAEFDPMGIILTLWLESERRIDVPKLRATVREHATAGRILVDRVVGTVTARTSGAYLRTDAGMEFRIEGKTDDVRRLLHEASKSEDKMQYRVTGEVILVEDKILILARVVRPQI